MDSIDKPVLQELAQKVKDRRFFQASGLSFRNKDIAGLLAQGLNQSSLANLHKLLTEQGALHINTEVHEWKDTDGEEKQVRLARASSTDMWPMGTHYWVRDNVLIARALLLHEDKKMQAQGKELILSHLTIMSSCSQLKRFEQLIVQGQKLPSSQWPHIFLSIKNNLNAQEQESWMHVQDAWQMLGVVVLQALQNGKLTSHDLNAKQKRFLGMLFPSLLSIDYTHYENAGSWEEFRAQRQAVLVWEYKLLGLLQEKALQEMLPEIERSFAEFQKSLPKAYQACPFHEALQTQRALGKEKLQKYFPGESTMYAETDARYRYMDAALIGQLTLGMCEDTHGERAEEAEEELYQGLLSSLQDEDTKALYRYHDDAYQRCGYFRPSTIQKMTELYGGQSAEVSDLEHYQDRCALVPHGRSASWTHFLWQLSVWAGERFMQTGRKEYLQKQERHFLQALSLITGEHEYTLEVNAGGKVEVLEVSAFRIPECYISDESPDGTELIFPSPHTPLNWSIGEALLAFDVMRKSLECAEGVGECVNE